MAADCQVLGVASSEYTYETPQPLWTQQRPDLWWQATVASIRELAPVLSLASSPAYCEDGILFAGTESHGLYRSEDRGRNWTRLGEDVARNAVNAILLSPEFPERADVLVMLGDGLLLSRDGGRSWAGWRSGVEFGESLACVAAPQGLDPDALLLVGLVDGGVLRI